jgi:glycosyltransferase involved in cell wall biosynthesis
MYSIAYFLDYGQGIGGAAKTLLQQAVLAKASGCEVKVYFSNYYENEITVEYHEMLRKYDIEFEYSTYQISSHPEDIDILCALDNYEEVKNSIENDKPDILHSVQINPLVEMISRELQIPHIMNIYPLLPEFFNIKYINIFPHYHLCDSWYWARKWEQYLSTDSKCIRTVAREPLHEKNTRGEITKYICVGSIYEGKNQLNVIKAFHKALDSGIKGELVLYGYDESSYAVKCKSYILENHLEGKVIFKGFCKDMDSVYVQSDVLICGSIRESFPNVISEAMANKVCVISTPVGGVPEEIRDNVNGYLTDDYTVESLYKKIIEYEEDRKKGKVIAIIENAYKTYVSEHSPNIVTQKLLSYYAYVLDDFPKRQHNDVGISDINNTFKEWRKLFLENKNIISESKTVSTKIWFLYHIRKKLKEAVDKGIQIYIWGTGHFSEVVIEMLNIFMPEIKIAGFIDTYKKGGKNGYNIYNPESVLVIKNIIVLVAILTGQMDVSKELNKAGLVNNIDYFIMSPRIW